MTTYTTATATALVDGLYEAIEFNANPPAATVTSFVAQLVAGTTTAALVTSAIENDILTTTVVDPVIRMYQAALGRVPDQAGESFWVNAFANGTETPLAMATVFANSAEFNARYGANANTIATPALVTSLYENVLQRAPDPAGLAYWVGTGDTVAQLLVAFANSPEFITDTTPEIIAYQNLEAAGTPPTTGSLFAVPLPPGGGPTFTLTQGVDNFSTNLTNATFNALPFTTSAGLGNNTLNTGDTLFDGAGDGTLNFITTGGASPALLTAAANPIFATGVNIQGIKTLNITNNTSNSSLPDYGLPSGPAAGFTGVVNGLQIVNDSNSLGSVQLGSFGQGLGTALTNLNISGYSDQISGAGTLVFTGFISNTAASASNTINIGITGTLGNTGAFGADGLSFLNDNTIGGAYGAWGITTNANAFVELYQGVGGGIQATTLTLTETNAAATIQPGQYGAGQWSALTTIDASHSVGTVIIGGAVAGAASNSFGAVASLGGSDNGLLDEGTGVGGGNLNLTTYKLGTGLNILDVSAGNVGEIAGLTTTPGATVNVNNEIIVADSVATTTSASTFAHIAGFDVLGIAGAAGTVNMANLPASTTTLDYVTTAAGAVTVNNQVNTLTINTEDNGNDQNLTVNGPSGLSDVLNLVLGDATTHNAFGGDVVGQTAIFGDEVVNISSVGGGFNEIGTILLTPTLIGNEQVTISGNTDLILGQPGFSNGSIASINTGGSLQLNNLAITITNTGVTNFFSDNAGTGPIDFNPIGDTTIGFQYSTNAAVINAATSGGLLMNSGDANYVVNPTAPAGTAGVPFGIGDTITGSSTGSNALAGSIGNDTFTIADTHASNTVATGGGADMITFGAGHSGTDVVDVYTASTTGWSFTGTSGGDYTALAGSITDANEAAQLGWWGIPTSGITGFTPVGAIWVGGLPGANSSTNADLTNVYNFNAATDRVDFSVSSWGTGGTNVFNGDAVAGLVMGDGHTHENAGHNGSIVITQVAPGGLLAANTDIIELSSPMTNLSAVQNLLTGVTTAINFAGTGIAAHTDVDMLVEWQDFSGNTHITDAEFSNSTGAAVTNTFALGPDGVHLSDMVELHGVSIVGSGGLPQITTHLVG
ncbi:MAG: DUF4214 domain-containing protein [Methylocystis sp.]